MMLDNLKNALKFQKNPGGLFVRTVLKEAIQDYILNFVYTNKNYKKFIFTGGTCLRKIYGLPRLSEDLDFDMKVAVDINELAGDLTTYFKSNLQYPQVQTKIANNNQTILVKFPQTLSELGLVKNNSDATMLFVRVDLVEVKSDLVKTEVFSLSNSDFSFFVLAYDLPTLLAHKIAAFLQRDFYKGGQQKTAFKGRDVFDLVWFLEKINKSKANFEPNWLRLYEILGIDNRAEIVKQINAKMQEINSAEVIYDLEPFVESQSVREGFGENFKEVVGNRLRGWA